MGILIILKCQVFINIPSYFVCVYVEKLTFICGESHNGWNENELLIDDMDCVVQSGEKG